MCEVPRATRIGLRHREHRERREPHARIRIGGEVRDHPGGVGARRHRVDRDLAEGGGLGTGGEGAQDRIDGRDLAERRDAVDEAVAPIVVLGRRQRRDHDLERRRALVGMRVCVARDGAPQIARRGGPSIELRRRDELGERCGRE